MKNEAQKRRKYHQHRHRHSENEIKYAYEGNPFAKYKEKYFSQFKFLSFLKRVGLFINDVFQKGKKIKILRAWLEF